MTFDRGGLRRTVAVANGKGGVGKTSTTAHIGGLAAAAGYRVLAVDLDPQGNLGEDLGYTGAELSDDGQGLLHAVLTGQPPMVLRDVRPNLDVIPGGLHLYDLAGALEARQRRSAEEAATALARVLAPMAGEYALVLVDCPPGSEILQRLALAAAAHLLIPTKTDQSSRRGLREMARRFVQAREINPDLQLLGVVLFGVTTGAKRIRAKAREMIEMELGGSAPVFPTAIRHVEAAAVDGRERGQLAHELERDVLAGLQRQHDDQRPQRLAASAGSLAADYQALTQEVLRRLLELESAGTEATA